MADKNVPEQSKAKLDEATAKLDEAKSHFFKKLEEDGVENPKGLIMAAFGFVFLLAIPVTSFIARPNGFLERAVNGLCNGVAYIGSTGSTSQVAQTSKIAALSTFYVAATYAYGGVSSAAGINAGTRGGRDNAAPRAQTANLRGLPLRMISAHEHIVENFGGFALTAALAQTIAPADQSLINLLGLHVIAKILVFWPSYIFNFGSVRSVAHIIAVSSVINTALRMSQRALTT